MLRKIWLACYIVGLFCLLPQFPAGALTVEKEGHDPVALSRAGQALLPIVIASNATAKVETSAQELAEALGKITGASFRIAKAGSAPQGIFLGTDADWLGHLAPADAALAASLTREDSLLKTGDGKLFLIGREETGVQNVVWSFLYRLGFRQFFPGKTWEIWPSIPDLTVDFHIEEKPDYYARNLFLSGGTLSFNNTQYTQWRRRNRMFSGFTLNTAHSYEAIIKRNARHFAENPGDICQPVSVHPKLNAASPSLLALVVQDALQVLAKNPRTDSLSADPSDGGGWCTDSPLGSPSNQALTITNAMARAIQERYPGKKVGMYAYNAHSPAPDFAVEPNVVVSVATAFTRDRPEEVMVAWQAKGAVLGTREYLAWWAAHGGGSYELPGVGRATAPGYLAQSIPRFYDLGSRYWTAETTDSWAPHGPGNYLVTRLLWNRNENAQEILRDFYTRAFGQAAGEMEAYYTGTIFTDASPVLSPDLIGRMYRTLERALEKEAQPEVRERIVAYVVYTRYLELLLAYQKAQGTGRQAAFADLSRFLHQTSRTGMVNTRAVFREFSYYDREIKLLDKEEVARLQPLTTEELIAVMHEGIVNNPLADFTTRRYSTSLVRWKGAADEAGAANPVMLAGSNTLYLSSETAPGEFRFRVKRIGPGARSPMRFNLYALENPLVDEVVDRFVLPVATVESEIVLKTPFQGTHRLEIVEAGNSKIQLEWSGSQAVVFPASPGEAANLQGAYDVVFFVPAGTRTIGGFARRSQGRLVSPDGKVVYDLGKVITPGYFSFPVPTGYDNAVWRLAGATGEVQLLTVPPYLARRAGELLVPAETAD